MVVYLSKFKRWYGVSYWVEYEFFFEDYRGRHTLVRHHRVMRDQAFRALPCTVNNTVALPLSPLCTVCPANGLCDGTTTIRTAGNFWRPSQQYLPFLACPRSTAGCLQRAGASPEELRVSRKCAVGY
jgi:hypothetical protein